MSTIVYRRAGGRPNFPASDIKAGAAYYIIGGDCYAAVGGEPSQSEVDEYNLGSRVDRVARIEAERDAALLAGVEHDGKAWHTDDRFQAHITALVTAFEAGVLPANATVPIRTRTNTIEALTYTQLKALAGAVLTRVQEIWAASWAAKDALP